MMCDIPKVQLYLYLDGELDASEASMIERHLHTCEVCQSETASHQRLQRLLRSTLAYENAPDGLWSDIQRQLPKDTVTASQLSHWLTRKGLVAGLAVAVLSVLVFGIRLWFASPIPLVVQEIVDSQIRSQLMDASYKTIPADSGAVRRWFQDKVAFSVLVPKIPRGGYEFLGVRLNYFLDRRVAEIAYASRNHMLSFLMFSNQDIALKSIRTVHDGSRVFYVQKHKGYNTVLWKDGDFFCSLVSDLHATALLDIAREAAGSSSPS